MAFPMADWIVSLILLLALLLVARYRKAICAVDRGSFNNIAAGLVILALVSIGRVYNDLGIFHQTPFLSESTFYELIHWIGIITGFAFMISGISTWLPLAKNARQFNQTRFSRLEFVKKTEQLIGVESRLDKVLSATLDNILDHFEFTQGLVLTYSSQHKSTRTVDFKIDDTTLTDRMNYVSFDERKWHGYSDTGVTDTHMFGGIPNALGQPSMVLPVVIDDQPSAFFVLWSKSKIGVEDEGFQNLKIAMDIIARKVKTDRLRLKGEFLGRCESLRGKLAGLISGTATIKSNLGAVTSTLKDAVPFEMMTVTIFGESRDKGDRYTLSGGGTALVEKAVDLGPQLPLITQLFEAGRSTTVNGDTVDSEGPWGSMQSIAGCPLFEGPESIGCVFLGSSHAKAFSPRHIEMLGFIEPLFTHMVRGERIRIRASQHERRMTRVAAFTDELGRISSLQEAFEEAANLLADELKTCMVRISSVEDDGAFLRSRALVTPREIVGMVPVDGRMIVSLMGYHKLAMDSGRQVLVNQKDPDSRMSEAEAAQCLTRDLQSALIVPVQSGGHTAVVISLAEMRDWKRFRFGGSEVLFAEAVARALTLAIQKSQLRQQAMAGLRGRAAAQSLEDAPVLDRVKSPLTSILGSIEILRSKPEGDEERLHRYLGIIDRSARRIQEFLTEEVR